MNPSDQKQFAYSREFTSYMIGYLLDFSPRIWKLKFINNNIAICAIWLWNMVSYIKGGMRAKGIWKQDPEANI